MNILEKASKYLDGIRNKALTVVVGTVLGAIGSVIAFLASPIGLVLAAIVGLTGYVLYATGAMGNAVNWLSGTWSKLKEYAGETFQGIKDAFAGGDVKLAVKILWLSIKEAFLKGKYRRYFIYIAVRAFGWVAWRKNKKALKMQF